MLPTRRSVATQISVQQEGKFPPCLFNKEGICNGQKDAQRSWNILKDVPPKDYWDRRGREIIYLASTLGPPGRGKDGECKNPEQCNYYTER